MSELKVNKVTPRSGTTVTLGDSGDSVAIPTGVGFNGFNHRNIIINGDMSIAQRNTSVASITATGYYTVDRIIFNVDSQGTWTMSQDTDVPTGQGFAKSLKLDCTTADASPAASDFLFIQTRFEGQNLQYLKKGTANAVPLTLSFWVKSTKTGTFIAELGDVDNTRQISKSYTVIASDTWEKKTITFEGDTTGALDNDNVNSLNLNFWLGAGSDRTSGTLNTTWGASVNANRVVGQVNVADSTSNDFYITGVQLEAGTTASDFEFLPIDVSLGRCQRYFEIIYLQEFVSCGQASSTSVVRGDLNYLTQKRANPTITLPTVGTATGNVNFLASDANFPATTGVITIPAITVSRFHLAGSGFTSSFTAGNASYFYSNSTSQIKVNAEL
jgi:hypothetical protein